MDESGTDGAEFSRKLVNQRRVAGVIESLVNSRDLQLECARFLYKTLLVPVLMYGVRLLWKEKVKSRVKAIQMDNLRGWIES